MESHENWYFHEHGTNWLEIASTNIDDYIILGNFRIA